MYRIDPARTDLAEEFRRNPCGHHSGELQRILNVMRAEPFPDKHVLVCLERHRKWVVGKLSGERGAPVEIVDETVYTDAAEAEWAVFKRRWKALTGTELE